MQNILYKFINKFIYAKYINSGFKTKKETKKKRVGQLPP